MEAFAFRGDALHCENLPVKKLAQEFGTPLYLYSKNAFVTRYREIRDALNTLAPLICFSVKSNSNLSILKVLKDEGAGADIVSGGELYRCLKAGISPDKIVFAGVGKTSEEIRFALSQRIHLFNVESLPELHEINRVAGQVGIKARIALRLNPDVDADTHAYTTTGKKENKFGLPIEKAEEYFREAAALPHITVAGIDLHLGSPIFTLDPYAAALEKLAPLIVRLKTQGIPLEELDIGGGFGIVYKDEKPFTPVQFAETLGASIKKTGLRLILEPGRYIAGNSGILVTKIVYVKRTEGKNFLITDAGMNDLIRPPLYGSHHEIVPVQKSGAALETTDVVGPVCESSCFIGKNRRLPLDEGYLAVMSAGAYGFTMSSNYNTRPRACEVLVDGDAARVIRRRETIEDLVQAEL